MNIVGQVKTKKRRMFFLCSKDTLTVTEEGFSRNHPLPAPSLCAIFSLNVDNQDGFRYYY